MTSASDATDHDPSIAHDRSPLAPKDSFGSDTVSLSRLDSRNDGASQGDPPASQHHSLKYHLLGPSLTKAGQDAVDQKQVSEIIYNASKGSKYFNNEETKDKVLTAKIERIVKKKAAIEQLDLSSDLPRADRYIEELELSRDLSQNIVHVDCDAFYAAVEELDRPELKDVPFAVGQGVLTTCNYVARKYGCRSAMAGFVAKKLCPQLICLPLNFDKYVRKAKEVRAIFSEYDPRFESASLDEAYLNITEYCKSHDMDAQATVSQLRARVEAETKITVSAGIAANAKIAKICSNKNKPNGQFFVESERPAIMAFMRDLPTRKVNGIGRVFERELDAIGIKTCGDIYECRGILARLFGDKAFQFLIQTYLGLGRTNVQPSEEHERKSVGTESTFHDMSGKETLREKLMHTAEELEKDLKRTQFKGRTLVLKIKLHTYEVISRQIAPPRAIYLAEDLFRYSEPMLAKLEREFPRLKLRLMGLRCTHLISMKKASVNNFFGTRQEQSNTKVDADGWQVWPEADFEDAQEQEKQDDIDEIVQLSQELEDEAERKYNLDVTRGQNSDAGTTASTWNCPICGTPQPAEDGLFNAHIDHCLSRDTIRDALKETHDDEENIETSIRGNGTMKRKCSFTQRGSRTRKQPKLFFS